MEIIAAVVVVATLAAMASGKVPAVLALATGLAVGGILQLAPVSALFAGLSNGGVITVAGMLVVAKGVVKTGVIARATWRLLATVTTAAQAMRRLIVPVGVASALMNTTPLVAMLIPATRQLQQTRDVPAREVLLPIAHATTLVGSVTLIGTSSNLLIAGIAADDGVHVSMLSFAPVALPVCLVGWVLLLLAAPRMLRGEGDKEPGLQPWRVEVRVASRGDRHRAARRRTSASSALRSTGSRRSCGTASWCRPRRPSRRATGWCSRRARSASDAVGEPTFRPLPPTPVCRLGRSR